MISEIYDRKMVTVEDSFVAEFESQWDDCTVTISNYYLTFSLIKRTILFPYRQLCASLVHELCHLQFYCFWYDFFSVVWMDVHHDHVTEKRITAFACQNGFLKMILVDERNNNGKLCIMLSSQAVFHLCWSVFKLTELFLLFLRRFYFGGSSKHFDWYIENHWDITFQSLDTSLDEVEGIISHCFFVEPVIKWSVKCKKHKVVLPVYLLWCDITCAML